MNAPGLPLHPSFWHRTTSPSWICARISSAVYATLHLRHSASPNEPCASTIDDAGRPAMRSSVSMFCVNTLKRPSESVLPTEATYERSRPFSCSRRKK